MNEWDNVMNLFEPWGDYCLRVAPFRSEKECSCYIIGKVRKIKRLSVFEFGLQERFSDGIGDMSISNSVRDHVHFIKNGISQGQQGSTQLPLIALFSTK